MKFAHAQILAAALVAVMVVPSAAVVDAASGGYLSSTGPVPNAPNPTDTNTSALQATAASAGSGSFNQGTLNYLQATPQDAAHSIYRIFNENFEESCSGLPPGWTQDTLQSSPAAWHNECYDPAAYAQGKPTGFVHTGYGAAAIETLGQGYPAGLNDRLVSPVIDLRNVAGASIDSNLPTSEEPCTDITAYGQNASASTPGTVAPSSQAPSVPTGSTVANASANASSACQTVSSFSAPSLHGELASLEATASAYTNPSAEATPCPGEFCISSIQMPSSTTDLPYTDARYGFGLVNLTFYHSWDWKDGDGGVVEVRWLQQDGSWSSWASLQGDLIFETNASWSQGVRDTGCAPWISFEQGAGQSGATLLDKTVPIGVGPALCDPYNALAPVTANPTLEQAVSGPLGGTGSADLRNPGFSLSALITEFDNNPGTQAQAVATPNCMLDPDGDIDTPSANQGSQTANKQYADDAHEQDLAAYCGHNGAMLLSKYTLNRFIGTKVQIGFRALSVANPPISNRGWFVDDVGVDALLPTRDVGVLNVTAPRPGDTLPLTNGAMMPQAVIENFGHTEVDYVNVTFEVHNASTNAIVWTGYAPDRNLSLQPLETATLSPRTVFNPAKAGSYVLSVSTRIDPRVTPNGPEGAPETDVNGANDVGYSNFAVRDVARLAVVPANSISTLQTDFGATKTGWINLTNLGNVQLSGTVSLTAQRLDPTATTPTPIGQPIPIYQSNVVVPFGNAIDVSGNATGTKTLKWSWWTVNATHDPLIAGSYVLSASFVPDAYVPNLQIGTTSIYSYIRTTPVDAFDENFIPDMSSPYHYTPSPGGGSAPIAAALESLHWSVADQPSWTSASYFISPDSVPYWAQTAPTSVIDPTNATTRKSTFQDVGMWQATGESVCQSTLSGSEPCSSLDLLHWYPLPKIYNPPTGAQTIQVSFMSEGHFQYNAPGAMNRTRGLLRIVPDNVSYATDYADSLQEDAAGFDGTATNAASAAPSSPTPVLYDNITSTSPECGASGQCCGPVEFRSTLVAGKPVDTVEMRIEQPHYWEQCTLSVPLSFFGMNQAPGSALPHALRVEWVFNTSLQRVYAQSYTTTYQQDLTCQTDYGYPSKPCAGLGGDPVEPWYINNLQIESLNGSRISDRVESYALTASDWTNFFNCPLTSSTGSSGSYTEGLACRGWLERTPNMPALYLPSGSADLGQYPSNFYIENLALGNTQGTVTDSMPAGGSSGYVLRYGWLPACITIQPTPTTPDLVCEYPETTNPADGASPSDHDRYGVNQLFTSYNPYGVSPTPPSSGGNGGFTESIAASPAFQLLGLDRPVLTFQAQYDMDPGHDGLNTWLDGYRGGQLVFRTPIVPEGGYDRALPIDYNADNLSELPDAYGWVGTPQANPCSNNSLSGSNDVWDGRTPDDVHGNPNWVSETFDLAPYAACADQFAVEFHAVTTTPDPVGTTFRSGFFRISNLRVADAIQANDLAVTAMVNPAPNHEIGPGVKQTLAFQVTNVGLYNETGFSLTVHVYDSQGHLKNTTTTTVQALLPGISSGIGQRNLTVDLPDLWTCPPETATQAEDFAFNATLVLSDPAMGYGDTNPFNNVLNQTITCRAVTSMRIDGQAIVPDTSIVTPAVARVGQGISLSVPISNTGTLPTPPATLSVAVYKVGEGGLDGAAVLGPATVSQIASILVGQPEDLQIPSIWTPNESGEYDIALSLNAPITDPCAIGCPDGSMHRNVKITVSDPVIPAAGQNWTTGANYTGAWNANGTFGGPYGPFANGTYTLGTTINARAFRSLQLLITHKYDFVTGVDGGLVEISADNGSHWYPVPPVDGYPSTMGTASPLVTDPNVTVKAFSGTSNGYVTSQMDFSKVPQILRDATLYQPNLSSAASIGNIRCNSLVEDCLQVTPQSAGGASSMYYSDKYALLCNRTITITYTNLSSKAVVQTQGGILNFSTYGNGTARIKNVTLKTQPLPNQIPPLWVNGSICADTITPAAFGSPGVVFQSTYLSPHVIVNWSMTVPETNPEGAQVQGSNLLEGIATAKTIYFPLNRTLLDSASLLGGAAASYWDWRAIGTSALAYTRGAGFGYYPFTPGNEPQISLVGFNKTWVQLPPQDTISFAVPDSTNLYRSWTLNALLIPPAYVDTLESEGATNITLAFTQIVNAGTPDVQLMEGQPRGPRSLIQNIEPGDSDWISPSFGWAIAGLSVSAPGGGSIVSNRSPLQSHETLCLGATLYGAKPHTLTPAPINCPNSATRFDIGPSADWVSTPSILGQSAWHLDSANGSLVASPPAIANPTPVATGSDSRLKLPVDLKAAVGHAYLHIDTAFKFAQWWLVDQSIQPANGRFVPESGGRVEVSTDGGQTWVPIAPMGDAYTRYWRQSLDRPGSATNTPFGLDPQGDSSFGTDASYISGTSSGLCVTPTDQLNSSANCLIPMTFDLSNFTGKDILLGFHVFFSSSREAQGLPDMATFVYDRACPTGGTCSPTNPAYGDLADSWLIRNVAVTGSVLNADQLQLRFRAAAGNDHAQGWSIASVNLVGIKYFNNLAVHVLPLAPQGLVPSGNFLPVVIRVTDKGENAATNVQLTVNVNLNTANSPFPLSGPLDPQGILGFGPCSQNDTILPDSSLAPESAVNLCTYKGAPIGFNPQTNQAYTASAFVTDDAYASDELLDDNHDVATLSPSEIKTTPQIILQGLNVSPNAFDPASSGTINVTANLINFGASEASIASLTLTVNGSGGLMTLTRGIADLTWCSGVSNSAYWAIFRGTLERRTCSWVLHASDLAGFPQGIANVSAQVVTRGSPTDYFPRCESACKAQPDSLGNGGLAGYGIPLFLGQSTFATLGWADHVTARYTLTQPENTTGWYQTSKTCGGPAVQWEIDHNGDTGYFNHTPQYSFVLPPEFPTATGKGAPSNGGPAPPQCTVAPQKNSAPATWLDGGALRTPLILNRGALAPNGLNHTILTFWTRQQIRGLAYVVLQPIMNVTPQATTASGNPVVLELNQLGDTPDYATGRFIGYSVDLNAALYQTNVNASPSNPPYYESPHGPNPVLQMSFPSYYIWFMHFGPDQYAWQLDDFSISHLNATIGPNQQDTVPDQSDRVYRMVLSNSGSYTDSYGINLTDQYAGPAVIPAGWRVTVMNQQGQVLAFNGKVYTPPPAGCSAPVHPKFAPTITLDPGASTQVRVEVCIPVSETGAGAGAALIGVTATSVQNVFQNTTATLSLNYNYQDHPDMAIQSSDINVQSDPSLHVDQPRTVTVRVHNLGGVDAQAVDVRLLDTYLDGAALPTDLFGPTGAPVAPARVIAHQFTEYTFSWIPHGAGRHMLTAMVDPANSIVELRKDNNNASLVVNITTASWPDLSFGLTTSTNRVAIGAPVWVNATIKNHGTAPANDVVLTLSAGVTDLMNHSGSANPDDFIATLNPGQSVTLHKVWIPVFPGNVPVEGTAFVHANPTEPASFQGDNAAVETVAVLAHEISVNSTTPSMSASPGNVASATITVYNYGATPDHDSILVTAPRDVIPEVMIGSAHVGAFDVPAQTQVQFVLNLTIPPTMVAGSYPVTVAAVSTFTHASTIYNMTLNVTPVYALSLTTYPTIGGPGTNGFAVNVSNLGNSYDKVTVTAPALGTGWSLSSAPVTIAPYGSANIPVSLTVPAGQPIGVDQVFLVASDSAGSASNATLLFQTTTRDILSPTLASCDASGPVVIRPGSSTRLCMQVANLGNVRGEAVLVEQAPKGWTLTPDQNAVVAEVSHSATVPFTLVVPHGTTPGLYNVTVDLQGSRSNASISARVDVAESHLKVTDLTLTPRANIEPGTVVSMNATIANLAPTSGGLPVSNFTVALYIDDFLIRATEISFLGVGNETTVQFKWVAQSGEHVALILADPGNAAGASDQSDNARLQVVDVGSGVGILAAAENAVPDVSSGLLFAAVGLTALVAAASRRARGKE
ncbi:MAG: CARDB domain-containing protein [Thermoplasmatota archaeon]